MGRNTFDRDDGYSGQDYTEGRERAEGEKLPTGTVAVRPADAPPPAEDLPPEAGRRAYFDPKTGEVHGSGAGAGGGNPGEDYDSDSVSGDGVLPTGKGSRQPERTIAKPSPSVGATKCAVNWSNVASST